MSYQKEVLLRDVVEYIPAWTYTVLAIMLVLASELAFVIPTVAFTLAGLFMLRAIALFWRGHKIKRYQRQLTRLPLYRMHSRDVPNSQKVQFLGMGFEWTAIHTQRAYDLNQSKNAKYRQMPYSYRLVRRMEYKLEHRKGWQWLVNFTSSSAPEEHPLFFLNPWPPAPKLEGYPWLHAVGMYEPEQQILQELHNRVGHTLVLGTTRVGKTRLAELIISQDIARGDVVIVIDPKGDADLMLRCYSEALRAGREDKFYLFHLGYPSISAQYNPVGSFMRITEVATRIAAQMPGEGQSAAFREFVWGYVNQIAKGLVAVGKTPTYPLIKQYSQSLEPLYIEFMDQLLSSRMTGYENTLKEYQSILALPKAEDRRAAGLMDDISKISRDRDALARYLIYKHNQGKLLFTANELDTAQSLTKAFVTDQQYLSKLVASLDPFLEKMTTGAVADLISPANLDPQKPVFEWGSIIQSGGIVYVGLDALSDQEVARTVGASMLSDLTSQYGRIYKEGRDQGLPDIGKARRIRPIRVHIDEANEPADKTLIPSLNKAGGAGVSVTAYTQTSSDFEARLGSKAYANQMFGNFNTVIMFRVQDEDTSNMFVRKQRQIKVNDLLVFSGTSDSSDPNSSVDFTSSTQSRMQEVQVPLLAATDLLQLPKGQFFMLMDGNKLFKGRVPWLLPDRNDKVPDDIRLAAEKMREQYQSQVPQWYGYEEVLSPVDIFPGDDDPQASNNKLTDNIREVWVDDMDMDFALGSRHEDLLHDEDL